MNVRISTVFVMLALGAFYAAAGLHGAQNPNLSSNDPLILSDTHGYNFDAYMKELTNRVRMKWYTEMPDSARRGQKGRVVLVFTVVRDGTAQDVRAVVNSGAESLDRASAAAIEGSSPLPGLPADFSDDRIVVQFTFLYNTR